MISRRNTPNGRAGFTLVEMLVVIAIIAILAAILVPAVYLGLTAATDARIAIELSNLDAAMRQYKTVTHGYAYPPNFVNDAIVRAHIQQKFGRYDPNTATAPPVGLDAAEALVFWLQGYNSNPLNPLGNPTSMIEAEKERKELFDFDETRLVATRVLGGFQLYHYYPQGGQNVPYVYFHHDSYAADTDGDDTNGPETYGSYTYTDPSTSQTTTARPYKSTVSATSPDWRKWFVNADSYQIISAGQDGLYGNDHTDKLFPSGLNYTDGDQDNITNFSEGTLGDKVE